MRPRPLLTRPALTARPRRPSVAIGLLLAATLGPLLDAGLGGRLVGSPVDTLAAVVAGYLVGAWVRPSLAAAADLAGAVSLATANQLAEPGHYTFANDLFFFALVVGGPTLGGALVTARRRQVRELRALARVRARQHDDEVRAARLEEHSRLEAGVTQALMQRLGALVVQASGVRREPEADRVRAAASRMEQLGRATLDDLREVIGSLRTSESQSEPTTEQAPETPPPVEPPLGWLDVLVAGSGLPLAVEAVTTASSRGPAALDVVAGLAVGLPLLVRRRHPLAATTLMSALAVLMSLTLTPLKETVTLLLPVTVAAYALGAHARGWRPRLAGAGVLLAGAAVLALTDPVGPREGDGVVPTAVWLAVALTSGVVTAQHSVRAARLSALLARTEAGRGSERRLAVARQREAVARDLHDTVAHAMTVVCLHAQAAQLAPADPATHRSLAAVELVVREAMAELRSGLATLEAHDDLADELLAVAATLGLRPSVDIAAGLPAYEPILLLRVLREALVNVSRHAPGADVRIVVGPSPAAGSNGVAASSRPDGVVLQVVNGPAPSGGGAAYVAGSGSGLIGLAELLAQDGGRLSHGVTPEGGYRVTASIPAPRPSIRVPSIRVPA